MQLAQLKCQLYAICSRIVYRIFGMNVDILSSNPSIRRYFASAIPMMILVLVLWYFIKHFLARRRQTPYQRGVYEHLFFELATAFPQLWSRSGPQELVQPLSNVDKFKWCLIVFWNSSKKTIRAGSSDKDAEYDDLGAWSRFKRTLTRRWTSQIRIADDSSPSTTILEEGVTDHRSLMSKGAEQPAALYAVSTQADVPADLLEVPLASQWTDRRRHVVSSIEARPSSKGSSSNRNSGVMVEKEAPTWLQDFGKGKHVLASSKARQRLSRHQPAVQAKMVEEK